ncbi:MAG: wax ester/triacylglycerol synthase domain-containing protein, partial [Candidatus Binatia bacterium]
MSGKKLNRRLTGTDAFFLYVEGPRGQMNIGICHLYEGHLSRDEVIQSLSARMHLLPRYRQKVVFPPLRLAHPTWEEDPAFDVRNHVEERTLPPDADDQVLARVSGELLKPWMDHNRPLWKLTLLQGRADGNTAIVWEVHHAMVDGMSAIELVHVMHDQKADAAPPSPPTVPWQSRPLPDKLALCQDAVRSRLTETVGWLIDQVFSLFRPGRKVAEVKPLLTATINSLRALKTVPRSPFTQTKTSGDRQGVWVEFPLTDVRAIRSAFGGSINDVAFAVIAGGMGRYMRAHGYPTEGVMLRTLCPVSLRQEDERGTLGNIIAMVAPPL